MTGHVLGKDLRLLWPFVAGLVLLQAIDTALAVQLGILGQPFTLWSTRALFETLLTALTALLIVVCVHQEAIAGDDQDWLARPFQRLEVLGAKLAFVLVAVIVPQLLLALLLGLVQERPFGEALAIAFAGGTLAFVRTLPVVLVAALSRSLLEAVAGLLVLAVLTFPMFSVLPLIAQMSSPLLGQLSWIGLLCLLALIALGAAIILPIQYRHRPTVWMRGAFAAGIAFYYAVLSLMPWEPAWALQQARSGEPGRASGVTVSFDPGLGRFRSPGGEAGPRDAVFFLPLRFSGLPRGAMLVADHVVTTLTDTAGRTLYRGSKTPFGPSAETNQDGAARPRLRLSDADAGVAELHQGFAIPEPLYAHVRNQPVRVRVEYSFTLLARRAPVVLAMASSERQRLSGIGLCALSHDPHLLFNHAVTLGCFTSPGAPNCFVASVHDRRTGSENPPVEYCPPDFAPDAIRLAQLANQPGHPLIAYGFGNGFDSEGNAYPVQFDQWPECELHVTPYVTQAWFSRSIETPPIRLGDYSIVVVPHMRRHMLS